MQSSLARLFKCFTHRVHTQTIHFDIHLHTADSITCSGYFKIHIAQMIFITEDISKNSIFVISGPGD